MMESSFTILRVRGIPIGAHWSWLFVFALVVWSLATVLFPATYPGLDGATYLAMAGAAAAVFFASVLAHELGHALRAVGEGERIDGITLWLFGGVARRRQDRRRPGRRSGAPTPDSSPRVRRQHERPSAALPPC
jgi:Zn-dependent protease